MRSLPRVLFRREWHSAKNALPSAQQNALGKAPALVKELDFGSVKWLIESSCSWPLGSTHTMSSHVKTLYRNFIAPPILAESSVR
jgi:hypothetical protein